MITAGIDTGSRAIKIVLWDNASRRVVARGAADQGVRQQALAQDLFDRLLAENDLRQEDIARCVATGYGRTEIDFADTTITEITCHAVGVRHRLPEVRTIVEIGGQDSKLIRLSPDGAVRDFAMNDRCAAGTGRFLEMVANRLEVSLAELGRLAEQSTKVAAISNMCAVFAETEIIGLLAEGESPANIVAGVEHAVATRLASMAGRTLEAPAALSGGVATIGGIREALEHVFDKPFTIPDEPVYTGALGAALLAARG